MKKISIDQGELVFAMQGGISDHVDWYLDTETGAVIFHMEDDPDYEEWCEKLDNAEWGRYLPVHRVESREGFAIMEDFARAQANPRLRDRLLQALAERKPFRHFKELVERDPHLREPWFAFRDAAYVTLAEVWLAAHEIVPEWAAPPPGSE